MDPSGYCRDGTGIDTGISYGYETPYTGNVVVVYDVKSSGDIYSYGDYNVSYSYGIIPPDMSSAIYVFLILTDGRPIKFAGSIINASYGINRQNK